MNKFYEKKIMLPFDFGYKTSYICTLYFPDVGQKKQESKICYWGREIHTYRMFQKSDNPNLFYILNTFSTINLLQ